MHLASAVSLAVSLAIGAPLVDPTVMDPATKARCDRASKVPFPSGDRPSEAERKALEGCQVAALYYGLGHPKDPSQARKCAYARLDEPVDYGQPISPPAILMMIYANGEGVPRDLDLAMRLACTLETAPAEMELRTKDLEHRKGAGGEAERFDLCDDITSSLMMMACAQLDENLAAVERKVQKDAATYDFPKLELAKADAAAEAYFESREHNEFDGPAFGAEGKMFPIQERTRLEDEYLGLIVNCQSKTPLLDSWNVKRADAKLNRAYRHALLNRAYRHALAELSPKQKPADDAPGTLTATRVRETQRLWIAYRDAWIALAKQACPQVPSDSWKTWLSLNRATLLEQEGDLPVDLHEQR